MYLVYLPSYFAFASKNENRFHSYILKTASENNIPTIDMYNVFLKNPNPLELFSLQMNSHYNPIGYNLVAENILERLERENEKNISIIIPTLNEKENINKLFMKSKKFR